MQFICVQNGCSVAFSAAQDFPSWYVILLAFVSVTLCYSFVLYIVLIFHVVTASTLLSVPNIMVLH